MIDVRNRAIVKLSNLGELGHYNRLSLLFSEANISGWEEGLNCPGPPPPSNDASHLQRIEQNYYP